jgi:nucleoside-diphosphate-sugar epimerase
MALAASRARTIVYLGSGECYGRGEPPFREDSPLLGTSPYARVKIDAEHALGVWARECPDERQATVLRLGVVYGAGQTGTMLVPSLLAALRERRPFPATLGEQTRDLIAVADVARAVAVSLDSSDQATRVYNIGSGCGTRITEIMDTVLTSVATHTGEPLGALQDLVQRGALPYRADEQMRYELAIERARCELGWSPALALAAGIDLAVRAAFMAP